MNFGEMKDMVLRSVAREGDSVAISLTERALNFASALGAAMFEPPELKVNASFDLASGVGSKSLADFANLLEVRLLLNNTSDWEMRHFPFEFRKSLLPTSLSSVKYYSIFGDTLYVDATPSVLTSFSLFYSKYPTDMSGSSDTPGYSHHDPCIVSVATAIVWACFEEGEAANLWKLVSDLTQVPLQLGQAVRSLLDKRIVHIKQTASEAKQ